MKSLLTFLFLAMASTMTFAQTEQATASSVEGTWSYTVETPDGNYTGKLVFTKEGDSFSGKMITQSGEAVMKNLKVTDTSISFSAEAEGYFVEIKGKVEGDSFTGGVGVEGNYFGMKGKRE